MPLPRHLRVLCPEWLEVNREADLASAVHFGGLAVQLGQLYFGRRGGVGGGDLKLPVELILDQVVDVPAHNGEGYVDDVGKYSGHTVCVMNGARTLQRPCLMTPAMPVLVISRPSPAFPAPVLPIVGRLCHREPVRVRCLIELDVLDECMQLLQGEGKRGRSSAWAHACISMGCLPLGSTTRCAC